MYHAWPGSCLVNIFCKRISFFHLPTTKTQHSFGNDSLVISEAILFCSRCSDSYRRYELLVFKNSLFSVWFLRKLRKRNRIFSLLKRNIESSIFVFQEIEKPISIFPDIYQKWKKVSEIWNPIFFPLFFLSFLSCQTQYCFKNYTHLYRSLGFIIFFLFAISC